MSAFGRGRNGSSSSSERCTPMRFRSRSSNARRKSRASSDRRSLYFVDGMESGLLQDANLALPECALLSDLHEAEENRAVALDLNPEGLYAVAGDVLHRKDRKRHHR